MKEWGEPAKPDKTRVAGLQPKLWNRPRRSGFTLVEVIMSVAIIAMVFSAVISAYIQSSWRTEWSGYSLAAQSLSAQTLEQARAGVWDLSIGKNELTNLNLMNWTYNAGTGVGTGYCTNMLDLPISGSNNVVIATNFVTLKGYYLNGAANPPVQLQMLTVNTVWQALINGRVCNYTNRTATIIAPDNRDVSSL